MQAPGQDDGAAELARACTGEGVASAYQPIVDTARGTVVGYEALARFPGFEEQDPEVWFARARRAGCAAELEAAALRAAFAHRRSLPPNCFLTVNVSPHLLSSSSVQDVWAEQGHLGGVIVELTEQTPIDSYLDLEPHLDSLRAAGALIAVDDAGSGYAGLQHLLALRPALIKVDRELVRDIDVDEAKRALIEMLGLFASRVDAWILAEGIERVEELDALAALGVPLVQGYLVGRPAPPWGQLDVDLALRLSARSSTAPASTVRGVVEPATTAASPRSAAELFVADPFLTDVVLLDGRRPVAVLTEEAARLEVVDPGLVVNVDTPVDEALTRSITRDRSTRFAPLLVTDNAGRFVGIARMERLIGRIAGQATPSA
ncbi:EAL domain-containing protein [Arthrobacter agilis]|uniref:EAL domain-containing protein n=1 Tax=Arthrobacter agilis TaxID=37921 RepID=UPI002786E85D|nr:EAL domain-containing protein [Arthrobacter agilis]MDQ0736075.1 EAL domain-containing protein (putative c-di-GMP-specific phosphodiesterase class I) [Arthrobacter agilis]